MPKSKKGQPLTLESNRHDDTRTNNPEIGLVGSVEAEGETTVNYEIDPNTSPAINWAGKKETTSLEVPLVSLHVHDRIEPQMICEGFCREFEQEESLFHDFDLPQEKAIEFYQHSNNWANRLIAGDSLLVMNSLLHKENLAESVKMIYIDPPYGIKYQSNFQPFMNRKPEGGDIDENLTSEPNQIQAFRDTWELGIHSYLTYLRDRLLVAYELLSPQGSCFVQIGDENVDLVAGICAEIFGRENRIATITIAKTSSSSAKTLPEVADYLIWYAKDKNQITFNQMYERLNRQEIVNLFSWHAAVELSDGECRPLKDEERFDPDKFLPKGARIFQQNRIDSMGESTTGRSASYTWGEVEYPCPKGSHWSVSHEGMDYLAKQDRLVSVGGRKRLYRKRYEEEVPGRQIHNIWWRQMYAPKKKYVVETSPKLAERCLLMSTNPGDLVLDPTCGSGTTAFVAETWGRRWITCDTSRVSLNLARQRLATSVFGSYALRDEKEGISAGYLCETIKTPSTKNLAYDEPWPETELIDQPVLKEGFVRVAGPYTVEAVPAPNVTNIGTNFAGGGGSSSRIKDLCDELASSNVRTQDGKYININRIELLSDTKWIHASGEVAGADSDKASQVLFAFGPAFAPLDVNAVEGALEESLDFLPKPKTVLFCAYQFDPEAARRIETKKWAGVTLLKVQMNADLLTKDLKKKSRSADSFWLVGQPEIEVQQEEDSYRVKVLGFDYFDVDSEELISGGLERIVMWMLDPDYNGRSFVPSAFYFPNTSNDNHNWRVLGKTLKATIDETKFKQLEKFESNPFKLGKHERIAVKVIDHRGIESLCDRYLHASFDRVS